MRKLTICSGFLAVWFMFPGGIQAFEQTPVAPVPGTSVAAPSENAPGLSKDETVAPGQESQKDTGLSFPGMGLINILPKLDFGLELMYGASPEEPVEDASPHDDVTIRGTVKKRF